MSPKELLLATMKAANEVRLPQWFETLTSSEGKLSVLITVCPNDDHARLVLSVERLNLSGPRVEQGSVGQDQGKDQRAGRNRPGEQRAEKSGRTGRRAVLRCRSVLTDPELMLFSQLIAGQVHLVSTVCSVQQEEDRNFEDQGEDSGRQSESAEKRTGI